MKRRVRLTEGDLHRIVKESVKRILREGGHLYGHYEDGTPFTNSKETWRGVPGSTYISHGSWSDPEIWYDGHEINANDAEESLWYSYKDECEENGEEPTEDGFEAWVDSVGVEYLESTLQDLCWALD